MRMTSQFTGKVIHMDSATFRLAIVSFSYSIHLSEPFFWKLKCWSWAFLIKFFLNHPSPKYWKENVRVTYCVQKLHTRNRVFFFREKGIRVIHEAKSWSDQLEWNIKGMWEGCDRNIHWGSVPSGSYMLFSILWTTFTECCEREKATKSILDDAMGNDRRNNRGWQTNNN